MNVFEQDPDTKQTMQNKSVANTHEAENCHQFNHPLHMLYFSYRSIYNTHNMNLDYQLFICRPVNSIGLESWYLTKTIYEEKQ